MSQKGIFASWDGPDMEIFDIFQTFGILNDIVSDNCWIGGFWGFLHQYAHAVLENGDSGKHDQNWEKEGTGWIGKLVLWIVPNEACSNNDTDGL